LSCVDSVFLEDRAFKRCRVQYLKEAKGETVHETRILYQAAALMGLSYSSALPSLEPPAQAVLLLSSCPTSTQAISFLGPGQPCYAVDCQLPTRCLSCARAGWGWAQPGSCPSPISWEQETSVTSLPFAGLAARGLGPQDEEMDFKTVREYESQPVMFSITHK
jgi:hypothetical protein